MFKGLKKINLSEPTTFWRYAVIIFGVSLILVFIGQTLVMFFLGEFGQTPAVTIAPSSTTNNLDSKKVNKLLKELDDRPTRLSNVFATTTVFIDPSL